MDTPTRYWWMFDNHTFRDLGTNLDEAIAKARDMFEEDPWGGLFVHGGPDAQACGRDKKPEFIARLAAFREDVLAAHCPEI